MDDALDTLSGTPLDGDTWVVMEGDEVLALCTSLESARALVDGHSPIVQLRIVEVIT